MDSRNPKWPRTSASAKRGQERPRWSQNGAKMRPRVMPRRGQEGAKRGQERKMEPKWSQDEAKRGQDGPRGAKRGQDGAKMGPRRNQHGAKIEVQKTLKKKAFLGPEPGSKTSSFYRTVCIFRPEEGLENNENLEKCTHRVTPFWAPK